MESRLDSLESGRLQLTPPQVHCLGGGILSGLGAGTTMIGQPQQAGPAVSRVGRTGDVPALHEVFDELAGGLLGDPEVVSHLGGVGIAAADAHERESVRRPDVVEPTAREAGLDAVHELAGEAEHHRRKLPTVIGHEDHVDTLVKRVDHKANPLV